MNEPKALTWSEAKTFAKGITKVIVNKSDGPHPRYSVRILRTTDDGRSVSHFGILVDTKVFPPVLKDENLPDDIGDLLEEAQAWVLEEVTKREKGRRKS